MPISVDHLKHTTWTDTQTQITHHIVSVSVALTELLGSGYSQSIDPMPHPTIITQDV